jgi:hypothetical protein
MTERDPYTQQIPAGQTGDRRAQTTPGLAPVGGGASAAGPGSYGYGGPGSPTQPDYSTRPVAVRGPASLAGLLLILAGIAAAVSLALRWLGSTTDIGLDLVRRGFDEFGGGFRTLVDSGFWQPLAVVLGGGVLLLLGVLMWLPARSHRLLGLLALLVSGLAIAAVVVPLVAEEWQPSAFGLGFWFACAVGVLGLLGALKALLTGRKYR